VLAGALVDLEYFLNSLTRFVELPPVGQSCVAAVAQMGLPSDRLRSVLLGNDLCHTFESRFARLLGSLLRAFCLGNPSENCKRR
jgi:hypothetical protein